MTCDANSEFPFCSDGTCSCTKTKGKFEKGDGTTTGSCSTTLHKCQENGRCLECQYDSQCTGLSNKCISGTCSCGDLGHSCNETRSNACLNGQCKCGYGDQCASEMYLEEDLECATQEEFNNPAGKCAFNGFSQVG